MSILERPARLTPWDGTARFACIGTRRETQDVMSFRLATEDGTRVRFHAGQAITLEWVRLDGSVCHRTFTIASPPTEHRHIELTVKAQGEGSATREMHERLVPGVSLKAYGPGGRFGLAYNPAERALLLAGGSGATPMMSMLRWVRDRGYDTDIAALFFAKTPADVLFAQELREIEANCARVSVTLVVSQVPRGEGWLGPRGRLSRRLLSALVPDLRQRETFLCGPSGFMETARRALRAEGLEPERVHAETFHPLPLVPPAPIRPAEGHWTAHLTRSGRRVPLAPDRPLLASLRAAGVAVPTGCRQGICGTCKVQSSGGGVIMEHHGGLAAREEAAGVVLACCSFPTGDLSLEL